MARAAKRIGLLALLGSVALLAAPAGADSKAQRVKVELVVSRICKDPGEIDPAGAHIHERIQDEFRYQSLKVRKQKVLDLALDEVGGLNLPTGKRVQVRPLLIDERGVLMAVDVEGSVTTDLRVSSGHLVIIGTRRHKKCKLVISLEPTF